jgi:protein-L-isoaspartate(D-aspartate) O-methyltransferase
MSTVAERVRAAFAAVPREAFLPPDQRRYSGRDMPLPIGYGQTNSQPTTVRQMLELLDPREGHRVLDVGSGSAWTTGLLAHLVGPQGRVYAVERVRELVAFGAENLAALGVANATVEQARPGVLGLPEHAPYDRILVSAEARALPAELVDQLAPGGVLVIPVSGRMLRVRAGDDDGGRPTIEEHGWYRFVPLVADPPAVRSDE